MNNTTALKSEYIDSSVKTTELKQVVSNLIRTHSRVKEIRSLDELAMLENLLERFKELAKKLAQSQQQISMPTSDSIKIIKVGDIVRVQADRSYSTIYLDNGSTVFSSKTLKQVAARINSTNFVRCHSSHLINLEKVTEVTKVDGGSIVLDDGSRVPIARNRKRDVLQHFEF